MRDPSRTWEQAMDYAKNQISAGRLYRRHGADEFSQLLPHVTEEEVKEAYAMARVLGAIKANTFWLWAVEAGFATTMSNNRSKEKRNVIR